MTHYCQKCQTAAAVVHVTELKGGKKIERHLCEECAEELDLSPKPSHTNMLELFAKFMQNSGATKGTKDRQCPQCGMTFAEFKAKGRFGCSRDYDVFLNRLMPLLDRIHGASQHVDEDGLPTDGPPVSDAEFEGADLPKSGDPNPEPEPVPEPANATATAPEEQASDEPRRRLRKLKRDLKRVVNNEEYEEAATIRDEIKGLEDQLGEGEA